MELFGARLEWPRFGCALGLSLLISLYGWKKRSLSLSGAMAAVVVGFVLTAASACFSVTLLVFFFTSSRLTKWRGKEKRKLEEDFKEGSPSIDIIKVINCLSIQGDKGTGFKSFAMEAWQLFQLNSTSVK